ncbi:hypothetical protein [Maritalea porphyrae]|uniref:hypothetical protein n=1 Tax=Maritalea porphyrae TaxID=880732 RepID=UPI0022AE7653|nr:hypothetical protein [Maritalea porphyrae]MCZ4274126.1 hypothetical protein [Maritalea porphyrae]
MKYRTRTLYSEQQKSEMWDRWQRDDQMAVNLIVRRLRFLFTWRELVESVTLIELVPDVFRASLNENTFLRG